MNRWISCSCLFLCLLGTADAWAAAVPVCSAKIDTVSGKDSTTILLEVQNPTANPVLMTADTDILSLAVMYHVDTNTIDVSMTPNGVAGTFGQGIQIPPTGFTLIYDQSPQFVATLSCHQ